MTKKLNKKVTRERKEKAEKRRRKKKRSKKIQKKNSTDSISTFFFSISKRKKTFSFRVFLSSLTEKNYKLSNGHAL